VEELVQFLIDKPHLGMSISFIIGETNKNFSDIPIYKDINELKNLILKRKINSIILTSDPSQSNELRSLLFECLSLGINFIGLSKFYEDITGKIPVRVINKMWFLENLNEGDKKIFDWFKRLYDILFALLIFFLTLPFWPLIAIAIKIESKGPVFIAMTRLGKNKKEFKMFKFRSMIEEGNMRTMTLFNDPRVTKFGSFMRKIRLDEIPQILNIIKGEMSFVGPRPERPELAEELEKQIPFFKERMLVKPGVTGWDQISGEYHSPSYEDTLKKIQYDLFYIKNRSIYLDASIILKTITTILSKKGI
jgi:exopolysaccharide biosynthesis polyprenyl glycosylphosphotransferase